MVAYPDVSKSIAELRPLIAAARDEGEVLRRVPPALGAELARRGFGRLSLPTESPGHELDPLALMTVMEELGAVDAATALVIFNNCLPALVSRHLPDDARAEIYADPAGMYANSTRPSGRAIPTSAGHVVTGRWTLVTGCQLADWFAFMALEWDGAADRPARRDSGPPLLMFMIPAEHVEIIDTWDAVGVRGSGSHDVVVDGVEVPSHHTIDFASQNRLAERALGRMPWMTIMAAAHGAISVGIARAAAEAFVELLGGKTSTDTGAAISEHPALQVEYLDVYEASRAGADRLRVSTAAVWEHALRGSWASVSEIADVFGAARLVANSGKRLTEAVLRWGGTAALYTDGVIERAWRDIQTINQHVLTGPVMAEQAGRVRLGLDPKIPSFLW